MMLRFEPLPWPAVSEASIACDIWSACEGLPVDRKHQQTI